MWLSILLEWSLGCLDISWFKPWTNVANVRTFNLVGKIWNQRIEKITSMETENVIVQHWNDYKIASIKDTQHHKILCQVYFVHFTVK